QAFSNGYGSVRGPVVGEDHLDIAVGLAEQRADAGLQCLFAVEQRYHDGNQRPLGQGATKSRRDLTWIEHSEPREQRSGKLKSIYVVGLGERALHVEDQATWLQVL